MMWGTHEGMGWWMLWGSAAWILVVAVTGAIVYWAVSAGAGNRRQETPGERSGDDALAIARRRYASGEINREQFEEIRRDLGG